MDVTTRRPAHFCKNCSELQNLARFPLARRLTRSCRVIPQPIKRAGSEFSCAVPSRPSSLYVRSFSQHHQNVELPSRPSLSEIPSEGIPAAACSSDESREGASEGAHTSNKANDAILAGANTSEKPKTSDEGNAQASATLNEDFPESTHASEISSLQNDCLPSVLNASERPTEGLPLSTHSSQGPSSQDNGLPSSSHGSAGKEVADVVDTAPGPWIKNIPHRYKLILNTSIAFVICNMDKVNLSVAIIPMSNQLHWNASTAGLVQSSFFWGYTLSQLPGGWFAKWFTGEAVLGAGVFLWSIATAAVPITASFIPALLLSRLVVGLGEGVSPSAATDLIARNIPATERSRAVAFVFNGLNVGSVMGLVLAPVIIEHFGWESVFYIFALLGIIWCMGFTASTEWNGVWETWDRGKQFTLMHPKKTDAFLVGNTTDEHNSNTASNTDHKKIPWRAFFKSPPVWAMIYTHFCGNWGHYCILAWLPTYFSDELNLNLTNAALVAVLPPLGGMFVSGFAAPLADHLISKGVNATFVRKLCQTIAFLSPTAGMTIASFAVGLSPWVTVSIITSSLALSSFALGGLYCTHQDISPKYASILLGITNTAGAIPGVLGVYLTGVLLDQTHSWTMALFGPCIFFWITGALVWNILASSEPQSFED